MQAFKIAVFERKDHEVDPPLRRSKRLSCKVAVSSGETALELASRTRLSISGPVTPPKRNRKVAFEDAEEKPREVQMAKKRKIEKPKLKENRTSNAKAIGEKTRQTFGERVIMRTITNRSKGKKSTVGV
ncbi:hypothetical protein BT96DRAFT_917520, partial [Gymnopus androsaceus JB14]